MASLLGDALTGVRTTIASDGLVFPGAVAVGPDGSLYVTNHSNAPSGGQVLRISAVPEPSSLAIAATALALTVGCGIRRVKRRIGT